MKCRSFILRIFSWPTCVGCEKEFHSPFLIQFNCFCSIALSLYHSLCLSLLSNLIYWMLLTYILSVSTFCIFFLPIKTCEGTPTFAYPRRISAVSGANRGGLVLVGANWMLSLNDRAASDIGPLMYVCKCVDIWVYFCLSKWNKVREKKKQWKKRGKRRYIYIILIPEVNFNRTSRCGLHFCYSMYSHSHPVSHEALTLRRMAKLTWCHAEIQYFHLGCRMQLEKVHGDFPSRLHVHFAIPKEHFLMLMLLKEFSSCD